MKFIKINSKQSKLIQIVNSNQWKLIQVSLAIKKKTTVIDSSFDLYCVFKVTISKTKTTKYGLKYYPVHKYFPLLKVAQIELNLDPFVYKFLLLLHHQFDQYMHGYYINEHIENILKLWYQIGYQRDHVTHKIKLNDRVAHVQKQIPQQKTNKINCYHGEGGVKKTFLRYQGDSR